MSVTASEQREANRAKRQAYLVEGEGWEADAIARTTLEADIEWQKIVGNQTRI